MSAVFPTPFSPGGASLTLISDLLLVIVPPSPVIAFASASEFSRSHSPIERRQTERDERRDRGVASFILLPVGRTDPFIRQPGRILEEDFPFSLNNGKLPPCRGSTQRPDQYTNPVLDLLVRSGLEFEPR